jgi:hypothetical protein
MKQSLDVQPSPIHPALQSDCVTTLLPVLEGHGSPLEWLPPSSEKAAGVLPEVRAAIGPASQARIRHHGQLTTTSLRNVSR